MLGSVYPQSTAADCWPVTFAAFTGHAVPTSSQSTRLVRPSLRLSHNQNRRECICRSV